MSEDDAHNEHPVLHPYHLLVELIGEVFGDETRAVDARTGVGITNGGSEQIVGDSLHI